MAGGAGAGGAEEAEGRRDRRQQFRAGSASDRGAGYSASSSEEHSDRMGDANSPNAKYDGYSGHDKPSSSSDSGGNQKAGSGSGGACGDGSAIVNALDKRITTMQKELNSCLRRVGEKESEKFDLIFAILSELQSRQAKLEETVRALRAQQSQQCTASTGSYGGQDNMGSYGGQDQGQDRCMPGSPNGNCQNGGCTPMGGQMHAVQFMPQVVIMSSPAQMSGAGMQQMQYAMMPQPGTMQPMPGQMAMHFMGQDLSGGAGTADGGVVMTQGEAKLCD